MRSRMTKLVTIIGVLSLGLGLAAGCAPTPGGEKPEQFYQGKTITWIVASGRAGDSTDLIVRILAPHLEKATGATVKVENMGTEAGRNYAYAEAKPDGLTLMTTATSALILNDVLQAPGVLYDIATYNYIADVLPDMRVFNVSPKSPYRTIDDLRQAKGLIAAGTSAKGSGAVTSAFSFEILGLDGKVVTGYGKKDASLALARGEVDIECGSDVSAGKYISSGNGIPLFVLAGKRSPIVPNVPTLGELGVKIPKELEAPYEMLQTSGKAVAVTPGSPEDRVEYLRKIFKKLGETAEVQADVKAWAKVWRDFVPGKELQDVMTRMKANKALGSQLDAILTKYKAVK